MYSHLLHSIGAFALAAVCGLSALACAGCSADGGGQTDEATAENPTSTGDEATGRTMLLPDWYFNNTSDEDVIEILLNAGCTSAERSGDSFAVTMPDAYAEAFVSGMKGEVADIVAELTTEAEALGATLTVDDEYALITLTIPADVYATQDGSNLALNTKAAAAAAYVYRSAADLGACEAVVVDENGSELSRATLPDDHEELLSTPEAA